MDRESEWKYFTEVDRVAKALGRNNERGFELLVHGRKRDPIQIDNNGDPLTFGRGYRGEILMETLCRLAYIADPYEVSRVTIRTASEMGGLPVCLPDLPPKAGMLYVADAKDDAYATFVHTLIDETTEIRDIFATDRQKQQIRDLSGDSERMIADVCKAALAAAVWASHYEWDTDHNHIFKKTFEAGMWGDGNLPT